MRKLLILMLLFTLTAYAVDDAAIIERIKDDPDVVWQAVKPILTVQQLTAVHNAVRPTSQAQQNTNDMIADLKQLGYTDLDSIISSLVSVEAIVTDNDIVGFMRKDPQRAVPFLRNAIDADEYAAITQAWKWSKLIQLRTSAELLLYDTTYFDTEITFNSPVFGAQ